MLSSLKLPCILIAPQCPARQRWLPLAVNNLLDELALKYRVDVDRIYLTGVSMGGYGSWDTAAAYPQRFAAVVPIAGGGEIEDAPRLKDLPIWAFHGAKDSVVPIEKDQRIIDAIQKISGRVRFTIYPEADHDFAGVFPYQREDLFPWLLAQKRGHPAEPPATRFVQ
jgi:predicted peptidase